ncbi:lipase 3-like [Daktulosphaira vitifoliae]|uniref:lipase 3-like n=1 Tax=Daktulosphaira vitifoliae TaxID=58002 RepID=UPI0021A9B23F|nr:lipase 3-like [Daktulosphaira vitifoliae]
MFILHYFSLTVLTFLAVQDLVLSLTSSDKIISYGYPLEIYQTKTEDDALLGMERIPHGKRFNGTIGRPVILMCGLLSISFPYVMTNVSMAYSLADAGFDVWLLNHRAMGLSKNVIDPKTGKKRKLSQINWNYSIHELGVYDFPAVVDFVLNHTKYSKVDVVDISLGTGILLIGLSERPEYNAKIRNNIMIAPAVRNAHTLGLRPFQLRYAQIAFPVFIRVLKRLKFFALSLNPDNNILGYFCRNIFYYHCLAIMIYFDGFLNSIDHKTVADIFTTHPQLASSKYYIHVLQLLQSGRFQNFDYGPIENIKHYNSTIVPEYNVTKVTAPSIIIYSKDDLVVSPADIKWLLNNMPNIKETYFIQKVPFSHFTFLLGEKAHTVLHPYIVKKLLEDGKKNTL